MTATLALLALALAAPQVVDSAAGSNTGGQRKDGPAAARVSWSATGGTINSQGLYTAGPTPGHYRVIASLRGRSGAATVTLTGVQPARVRSGIPFGPFGGLEGASVKDDTEEFTLTMDGYTAENIIERLTAAPARNLKLILAMTGGAHRNYMTGGMFDMAKWKAKMDTYDRPDIKAAVAAAVENGTVIGNSVMDEPQNTSPDNRWGPAGTMTKAMVDEMCGYVKAMFPTLPVGVVHTHAAFEPMNSYKACDFIIDQYRWGKTKGDVEAFRDAGLALGRRDGIAIAFSLNVLDGGMRVPGCPVPETGGPGTGGRNCRMNPAQVRDWGIVLGTAGCALTMWRYDPSFMANPENKEAFKEVATRLASLPAKPCRRSHPASQP